MNLRVLLLALMAVCGGLAWLCFSLYAAPLSIDAIEPGPPWSPDLAPPAENGPSTDEKSDPAILARLVFSPTRRPPEPRPAEPKPVEAQPEKAVPASEPAIDVALPDAVVLQGIFIDSERRRALIASPSHPDGAWLKAGDELEGWTVSRIEEDEIALTLGQREVPLTLYVDNARK